MPAPAVAAGKGVKGEKELPPLPPLSFARRPAFGGACLSRFHQRDLRSFLLEKFSQKGKPCAENIFLLPKKITEVLPDYRVPIHPKKKVVATPSSLAGRPRGRLAVRTKKKTDNLNRILEFAREKKVVTNDDVHDYLHISQSTATKQLLTELVNRGILKRKGERGGQYIGKLLAGLIVAILDNENNFF